MCENKEESLWEILISIFDGHPLLSTPKSIAISCYKAGYTNTEHIKDIFFNTVLPVCFLPVFFDLFDQPLDEKQIIADIKKYEKSIFSRLILKALLPLFSKKKLYEFFDKFEFELQKLKDNS